MATVCSLACRQTIKQQKETDIKSGYDINQRIGMKSKQTRGQLEIVYWCHFYLKILQDSD